MGLFHQIAVEPPALTQHGLGVFAAVYVPVVGAGSGEIAVLIHHRHAPVSDPVCGAVFCDDAEIESGRVAFAPFQSQMRRDSLSIFRVYDSFHQFRFTEKFFASISSYALA